MEQSYHRLSNVGQFSGVQQYSVGSFCYVDAGKKEFLKDTHFKKRFGGNRDCGKVAFNEIDLAARDVEVQLGACRQILR